MEAAKGGFGCMELVYGVTFHYVILALVSAVSISVPALLGKWNFIR
jgi:hypothetical protein